jgi:hypothetical protein
MSVSNTLNVLTKFRTLWPSTARSRQPFLRLSLFHYFSAALDPLAATVPHWTAERDTINGRAAARAACVPAVFKVSLDATRNMRAQSHHPQ